MGNSVLDRPMVGCGLALVIVERHEGDESHTVCVAPHSLRGLACRTSSTLIRSAEFTQPVLDEGLGDRRSSIGPEDPVNVQQEHLSHGQLDYLGRGYWATPGHRKLP
jgi:hypothetical protein